MAHDSRLPLSLPVARSDSGDRPNFDLKEEIREYWSKRAETFDLSWGHGIHSDAELDAWSGLFADHLALRPGSRVLELASGTGEVTRILLHLGCEVDGIDLCEPMIARARTKHFGAKARFHLGDAENTLMPGGSYDAVVCRHLVWTLIDPERAFADWFRVLKPGGSLLIADGDWVTKSWRSAALRWFSSVIDRCIQAPRLDDQSAHERIIRRVYFRDGLRAHRLMEMLGASGFADLRSGSLSPVKRQQFASASWKERLHILATYDHAFIVSARKPAAPAQSPKRGRT